MTPRPPRPSLCTVAQHRMTLEPPPQAHGARVAAIGQSLGPGGVASPQIPGIQPYRVACVEAARVQRSPNPGAAGLQRVAGVGQRPCAKPSASSPCTRPRRPRTSPAASIPAEVLPRMHSMSLSPVLSAVVEQRKDGRRSGAGVLGSGEATAASAAVEVLRRRFPTRQADAGQQEPSGQPVIRRGRLEAGPQQGGRAGCCMRLFTIIDLSKGKRISPDTVCHAPQAATFSSQSTW